MSQYGSKDIGFVLVDGHDILSNVLGLTSNGSEPVTDAVTPLGASWPTVKDTGERTNMGLSLDVLYDDAVNNTNSVIVGSQGVARVLLWNITGNAIGRRFEGHGTAITGKVKRMMQSGKLHRGTLPFEGSGCVEEGVILHPHQQETAAGNTQASSHDWTTEARARSAAITSCSAANPTIVTTSGPHGLTNGDKAKIAGSTAAGVNGVNTATVIDATHFSVPVDLTGGAGTGGTVTQASTPNGGSGYSAFSQLALGGYTNVIPKIRHSADNSTWADLITFTAVTTAPKAERVTVAGTINQFTAASWALTGSGSGPSFTFMVGLARADANT